jgi:hypothetical protein
VYFCEGDGFVDVVGLVEDQEEHLLTLLVHLDGLEAA